VWRDERANERREKESEKKKGFFFPFLLTGFFFLLQNKPRKWYVLAPNPRTLATQRHAPHTRALCTPQRTSEKQKSKKKKDFFFLFFHHRFRTGY
jgi:hypothetical protein